MDVHFPRSDYKYHNAISRSYGCYAFGVSENELIQFKTHEYLELIDGFYYKLP